MTRPALKRQTLMLAAGAALVVFVSLIWAYGHLAEARAAADYALGDTGQCRQLAGQIKTLRIQPSRVQSQELQNQEFNQRIEAAAQKAGIPRQFLIRITPEPARRIGETDYKRKPTRINFTRITMPQLVAFVQALAAEEAGPDLTQLNLAATHAHEPGEPWIAELTLTYLIYAPKQPASQQAS